MHKLAKKGTHKNEVREKRFGNQNSEDRIPYSNSYYWNG